MQPNQKKNEKVKRATFLSTSLFPGSVSLWRCFLCEAYAAHLDTDKMIYAVCLPLSEEQRESDSCFPKSRTVQGKSETLSMGEGGWKHCSAINDGSFTWGGHSLNFLWGFQQGHSLLHITAQIHLEVFAHERLSCCSRSAAYQTAVQISERAKPKPLSHEVKLLALLQVFPAVCQWLWRHTEICFRSEHCLLISTKVWQKVILRATTFGTKDVDSFYLCTPPASAFSSAIFPTPTQCCQN